MPAGIEINTVNMPLTSDVSVMYLKGVKQVLSKMSDQKLEYFSPDTSKVTFKDWYYTRLTLYGNSSDAFDSGTLDNSFPFYNADLKSLTQLRRIDITDLVNAGAVLFAISSLIGIPSVSFVYKSQDRYYIRLSATTGDDLSLTVYGFGLSSNNPKESFGLVLYDQNSNIAFDTSRYPMRVADVTKMNSSENYATICQYTSSVYIRRDTKQYTGFVETTGSFPFYISSDYKILRDKYICDFWHTLDPELEDSFPFDFTLKYYGVDPVIQFLNVTGYLD